MGAEKLYTPAKESTACNSFLGIWIAAILVFCLLCVILVFWAYPAHAVYMNFSSNSTGTGLQILDFSGQWINATIERNASMVSIFARGWTA